MSNGFVIIILEILAVKKCKCDRDAEYSVVRIGRGPAVTQLIFKSKV